VNESGTREGDANHRLKKTQEKLIDGTPGELNQANVREGGGELSSGRPDRWPG